MSWGEISTREAIQAVEKAVKSLILGGSVVTWQPIDTAPTYEAIIMFDRNEGVYVGERRLSCFIEWEADTPVYPTHWMPLPPPPESAAQ